MSLEHILELINGLEGLALIAVGLMTKWLNNKVKELTKLLTKGTN